MADGTHRPVRMLVTGGAGFIGTSFVRTLNMGAPDLTIVTVQDHDDPTAPLQVVIP